MAIIEIIAIEETPGSPRDLESVDGEEITLKVVDGELKIYNGSSGIFGTYEYTLQDLIGDQDLKNIRIEIRVKD